MNISKRLEPVILEKRARGILKKLERLDRQVLKFAYKHPECKSFQEFRKMWFSAGP